MAETFETLTNLLVEKRPTQITPKDLAQLFNVDYNEGIQTEIEGIEIGDKQIVFKYSEGESIDLYLTQNDDQWFISDITDNGRKTLNLKADTAVKTTGADDFVEIIVQQNPHLSHTLKLWVDQTRYYAQSIGNRSAHREISDLEFISKLLHAQKNRFGKLQIFEDVPSNY